MNTPFKALSEMIRLTSPFPESVTVKAWKARARRIIGVAYLAVPEEIIHAAEMLPFRVSGDNEPLPMELAEAYVLSNNCSVLRGIWQQVLENKYPFLDGMVNSPVCDGMRRLHDNWLAALEELDAVVVTDEMNIGTRCFWGQVDASLPPMEGIARHYLFNRPQESMIYLSNRFEHIFKMAKEYKVDGAVSEIVRYCAPLENDKPWLKKAMDERGIPIMELDLEYCENPSGQTKLRTEAFLEMLQTR